MEKDCDPWYTGHKHDPLWADLQDLQPQLIKTVGEVEALMVRIAKEKAEVVQPKAAAVAVDEAAAQAKVTIPNLLLPGKVFASMTAQ